MTLDDLKTILLNNLANKEFEIKRLFHGRGKFYKNFSYLNVDSLNKILFASFFEENSDEKAIIEILKEVSILRNFDTLIVQRKYKKDDFFEAILGQIPEEFFVYENSLKYKISFKNRNLGLFFDMKEGRAFIKNISKGKNVLNLFSYTCAFSVAAMSNEALQVVNIDLSKASLNIGRTNHHINKIDTKNVKFLPYDILKSIPSIKKYAPFDIVIIDPPAFQKGSFSATKDYEKIIRKLDLLTKKSSVVLACLNDPFLSSDFLINLFRKEAKNFEFVKRLENSKDFVVCDEEKALKNLVFLKKY